MRTAERRRQHILRRTGLQPAPHQHIVTFQVSMDDLPSAIVQVRHALSALQCEPHHLARSKHPIFVVQDVEQGAVLAPLSDEAARHAYRAGL